MPVLPWATIAVKENIVFPRYIAVSLCVCKLRLCMMRQLIAFETVNNEEPISQTWVDAPAERDHDHPPNVLYFNTYNNPNTLYYR